MNVKDQVIKNVYEKKIIAIVRGLTAQESFQTVTVHFATGFYFVRVCCYLV